MRDNLYLIDSKAEMKEFVRAYFIVQALEDAGIDIETKFKKEINDFQASWDEEDLSFDEFIEQDLNDEQELEAIPIGSEVIFKLKR